MKVTNFIGIDISKKTLDIAYLRDGEVISSHKIENTKTALFKLIKMLKIDLDDTLFCAEHTGIYGNILLNFLHHKGANLWMESALQIKRSQGMARGKNDCVDAQRIALYAYKNHKEAKLWKPKRAVIQSLSYLEATRKRLVSVLTKLENPIKDGEKFIEKKYVKAMEKSCRSTIRALRKDIQKIDKELLEIIKSDENLIRLFKITTSVIGIGKVTATKMIITTNEFKDFDTAKKYACYSGVVPFEHTSGTSIRGKTRISHLANKEVKCLLHLAALAAIRTSDEMKSYYERKLEEGKHRMSIINAVRNKIVLRVFACVKEDRLYQKERKPKIEVV